VVSSKWASKGFLTAIFWSCTAILFQPQLVAVWDDQKKKREYSWRGDYVLTFSSPEHPFCL